MDKVTTNEVVTRNESLSIETNIVSETLRRAGHLNQMSNERLPKITKFSELTTVTRWVGRPMKRYKEQLKGVMKTAVLHPVSLRSCPKTTHVGAECWEPAPEHLNGSFEPTEPAKTSPPPKEDYYQRRKYYLPGRTRGKFTSFFYEPSRLSFIVRCWLRGARS